MTAWLLALLAVAKSFTEPPPGSAVRRDLLTALRPAVEQRLGRNVEFNVTLIRVQGDWAFIVADPRRKGGKPIDGYRIFGEDFGNMDGLRVDAVLRMAKGHWTLVDYALGATDVWYCDLGPREMKAGWGC